MDLFKGQNLLEFSDQFKTEQDCNEYLAGIKWGDGFQCSHKKTQIKEDFSRTCNICLHQESITSNTLFYKVKFGVTEKKARLFMHKIREAMKNSGNHPIGVMFMLMNLFLASVKKGRAITAAELTEESKVKRMYAMRIKYFFAKSLQYMFVNHISRDTKAYNITQIQNKGGLNSKATIFNNQNDG